MKGLTKSYSKHEKTHTRPHKCSEVTCLYYEKGFPTDKERERHWRDKHDDSPGKFCCMFPRCPYSSKRDSNCKQHMEKAHKIQYVRKKQNYNRNPENRRLAARKMETGVSQHSSLNGVEISEELNLQEAVNPDMFVFTDGGQAGSEYQDEAIFSGSSSSPADPPGHVVINPSFLTDWIGNLQPDTAGELGDIGQLSNIPQEEYGAEMFEGFRGVGVGLGEEGFENIDPLLMRRENFYDEGLGSGWDELESGEYDFGMGA